MLEEDLSSLGWKLKNEQRFSITECINVFKFMRFLCQGLKKKRL